jgi:hypothetical protein
MADAGVAEPGQVLGVFELGHDELGDELGKLIGGSGDFFFVDHCVGGQPGEGVVSATPFQKALEETQRR